MWASRLASMMHENVANFASDLLAKILAKYGYSHHHIHADPTQVNFAMSRPRVYDILVREDSFEVVGNIAEMFNELTAHIRNTLPHVCIKDLHI